MEEFKINGEFFSQLSVTELYYDDELHEKNICLTIRNYNQESVIFLNEKQLSDLIQYLQTQWQTVTSA